MAWFIDDLDQTTIFITDTIREWNVPKFRIDMKVEEPYLYLRWNDSEVSPNVPVRLLTMNYLDVVDSYSGYIDNPSSATNLMAQIEAMIVSGWTSISTGGGDLLTNKGDLLSFDGVSDAILPVGDDTWILQANSAESTGLEWVALSSLPFSNYTDEMAQDAVGSIMDTADFTYNDGTPSIVMKDSFSYIIGYSGTVASTNTTLEEALANILIPGGTLAAGDLIAVEAVGRKTSGTGGDGFRVRIHSATGIGGTELSLASGTSTQSYVVGPKVLITGAATQIGWPSFSGLTYGVAGVNTTAPTLAIASDIYINITNTKVTGTDGFELRGATVSIYKKR